MCGLRGGAHLHRSRCENADTLCSRHLNTTPLIIPSVLLLIRHARPALSGIWSRKHATTAADPTSSVDGCLGTACYSKSPGRLLSAHRHTRAKRCEPQRTTTVSRWADFKLWWSVERFMPKTCHFCPCGPWNGPVRWPASGRRRKPTKISGANIAAQEPLFRVLYHPHFRCAGRKADGQLHSAQSLHEKCRSRGLRRVTRA